MGSKKIDDEYKTPLTCIPCREGSALTRAYQGGRELSGNFLELKKRVKSFHRPEVALVNLPHACVTCFLVSKQVSGGERNSL